MNPTSDGLTVTDLHKAFGAHPVLRGVDLTVPEGAFVAVLGAAGSGKTTMLRILAGFDRPDRGVVAVGGAVLDDDRHHVPAERRRIGYVPQEGSLFPHLTVAGNVGFGLRRGRSRSIVQIERHQRSRLIRWEFLADLACGFGSIGGVPGASSHAAFKPAW